MQPLNQRQTLSDRDMFYFALHVSIYGNHKTVDFHWTPGSKTALHTFYLSSSQGASKYLKESVFPVSC